LDSSNPNLRLQNPIAYLDFFTRLIHTQRQVHAFHFDISNAFDLVPHALLILKLDDLGLSPAYVTRFHSYLTNRLSHVRYLCALSTPY
jgi:hypothetical protein